MEKNTGVSEKVKRTILLSLLWFSVLLPAEENSLRFDFGNTARHNKEWLFKGKIPGVPRTEFLLGRDDSAVNGRILIVKAEKSSGLLMTRVPKKIWEKNPVMHWRWRIIDKVKLGPDGKEPDDQAVVFYFGDGTLLKQKTLAYRWEHHAGINSERVIEYSGGMTTVHSICVRNRKSNAGKWIEEYRNVVNDYSRAFGAAPKGECILSIGANTQYTQSHTRVEIDFIEFISQNKRKEKSK